MFIERFNRADIALGAEDTKMGKLKHRPGLVAVQFSLIENHQAIKF